MDDLLTHPLTDKVGAMHIVISKRDGKFLQLGKIHIASLTNILCNLDKYTLKFGKYSFHFGQIYLGGMSMERDIWWPTTLGPN